MMEYKNILYVIENGIAIVKINRPKALNALNAETVRELNNLMQDISVDKTVKVVVITGEGDKSFVAGADIKEMSTKNAVEGRAFGQIGQDAFTFIENMSQPVIAAVNGFCLGGGCELACACDIRYASDNAKFGQPEVTLGITPGFGGTQRLPRVIAKGPAKEILYTGQLIDAQEALRLGLVNKVLPQEELMDAVLKLANKIAKNAPIAVQLTKAAVNRGINCDVITGIAYEAEVFGLCFSTDDQKEGMGAFVEKRKPTFTGK